MYAKFAVTYLGTNLKWNCFLHLCEELADWLQILGLLTICNVE